MADPLLLPELCTDMLDEILWRVPPLDLPAVAATCRALAPRALAALARWYREEVERPQLSARKCERAGAPARKHGVFSGVPSKEHWMFHVRRDEHWTLRDTLRAAIAVPRPALWFHLFELVVAGGAAARRKIPRAALQLKDVASDIYCGPVPSSPRQRRMLAWALRRVYRAADLEDHWQSHILTLLGRNDGQYGPAGMHRDAIEDLLAETQLTRSPQAIQGPKRGSRYFSWASHTLRGLAACSPRCAGTVVRYLCACPERLNCEGDAPPTNPFILEWEWLPRVFAPDDFLAILDAVLASVAASGRPLYVESCSVNAVAREALAAWAEATTPAARDVGARVLQRLAAHFGDEPLESGTLCAVLRHAHTSPAERTLYLKLWSAAAAEPPQSAVPRLGALLVLLGSLEFGGPGPAAADAWTWVWRHCVDAWRLGAGERADCLAALLDRSSCAPQLAAWARAQSPAAAGGPKRPRAADTVDDAGAVDADTVDAAGAVDAGRPAKRAKYTEC